MQSRFLDIYGIIRERKLSDLGDTCEEDPLLYLQCINFYFYGQLQQ